MSYLPSNWAWGLDAQNNPVPTDGSGNPIPPPPGATAWDRTWTDLAPGSVTRPATPVAVDAQGHPVALPDTPYNQPQGISMLQAVVAGGLIVLAAMVFKRR